MLCLGFCIILLGNHGNTNLHIKWGIVLKYKNKKTWSLVHIHECMKSSRKNFLKKL